MPFIIAVIVLLIPALCYAQAGANLAAGQAKFQQLCATCHGATGKGDGAAAAGLNPRPRNFSDAAYMARRTDADLKKVILEGGPAAGLSALMPPWKTSCSETDIANLIAYIRSLSKGAK